MIHRDLKPDNIFISKDYKIKIGDFGITKNLNNNNYAFTQIGTFNYMAPEIIKGLKYNNRVDIWSLDVFYMNFVLWINASIAKIIIYLKFLIK